MRSPRERSPSRSRGRWAVALAIVALWGGAVFAQSAPGFDAVTTAVHAGTYKQITSVLVARHG
ncbi:MAG TPA: hypothetical protein VGH03_08965, partial [Caulobacteraceae bacterium]